MLRTEIENEKVILHISGRIDSTNAACFETEALEAIGDMKTVILDMDELEYISSAGLRVLLKLRKVSEEISAVNVSSEIYEILDMTGFTEMLNVQRRRRQISAEGCTEIARGAMGVVYRLDRDTILKVFDRSFTLESLYQAQDILKKLFINDVPCAIPFDIVDVGDAHGCVYEMIDMDTLAQYICKHPDEAEECGKKAAKLLKSLHQGSLPDNILPDIKDVLNSWVDELAPYLTEEDTAAYRKLISGFRDTRNLLHLDFHTKNIMIRGDSLMVIDLDDACTGDPLIDIGCMLMTLGDNNWDDDMCRRFIGISRENKEKYTRSFMQTYFETEDDEEIALLLKPLLPVTALRNLYARAFSSSIPPEHKKILIAEAVDYMHATLY